jgi:hypothetical protein
MVLRLQRARATIGCPDAEAAALIHEFGVDAHSEARRRECEASSDAIARDWTRVAMKVAQLAGGLIDAVDSSVACRAAASQTDRRRTARSGLALRRLRRSASSSLALPPVAGPCFWTNCGSRLQTRQLQSSPPPAPHGRRKRRNCEFWT